MLRKSGTIKLELERYKYPRKTAMLEVPALIVGDIAIHRPTFWHDGDAPRMREDVAGKGWTVSHVPTGSTLSRCLPDRYRLRPRDIRRLDLEHWAREFQREAPEFFDLCRDLKPREKLAKEHTETARSALAIGKGL